MRNRIVAITLMALIILCFSACSMHANNDEIEKRFESYFEDNNTVAILDGAVFYFSDHTLRLNDILDGEELNGGYLFADGKLWFSTVKENGLSDFSLFVYSCDLYGNDKTLLFEKHGFKTHPWATEKDGILYFEHYSTHAMDASARVIDSYNISSGVYQTEETGKTLSLSDYRKSTTQKYSYTINDEILSVIDPQKNLIYTIDTVALPNDAFCENLEGIQYSFCDFYVTKDGRMFLLYRIESNGFPYPHFVCEYIADSNKVEFKLLYFADDIETFQIEYLE